MAGTNEARLGVSDDVHGRQCEAEMKQREVGAHWIPLIVYQQGLFPAGVCTPRNQVRIRSDILGGGRSLPRIESLCE